MNTSASADLSNQQRFEFIGSGAEYFRIWIVNLFLSIITLGIYSAWAKVRRERYFHNHILLDGSPFEYHGDPISILKGRILIVVVFAAAQILPEISPIFAVVSSLIFTLFLPWIYVMALRFKAYNSSWRGIRFYFTGTFKEALRVVLGWGFINAITFGLAFPASVRRWHRFVYNNLYFGRAPFQAHPPLGGYYAAYASLFLAFIATGVTIGLAITALNFLLPSDAMSEVNSKLPEAMAIVPLLVVFIVYAALPLTLIAVVNVKIRNHLFSNLKIEEHQFVSDLRIRSMLKICLKGIVLTALTLGFYLPFFKVALLRYRTEHTALQINGTLDEFTAEQEQKIASYGEQAADIFDMDLSV